MKKSALYTGIGYVAAGVVCLVLALAFDFRMEPWLWGLAGAGIAPGLMMIWQYSHWTRPENREAYQKRLDLEQVELHDERNIMLRDKSGRAAYCVMIYVYCALMVAFSFCTVMGWLMPVARYAVIGLGVLLVVQVVCGQIAYWRLAKKL